MSDTILTQTELENLFQSLTSTILGTSLASALTSGAVYTSLSVNALTIALSSGDSIVIDDSGTTQTVTVSADAAVGATSISVASFTATSDFSVGASVYEPNNTVRIEWPTDGAPSWSITQDVCFLQMTPVDDNYGHYVQTEFVPLDANMATVNQTYTDGVRVEWTFYGPNAFDNARLIWASLFTESVKSTLQQNNIPLVTDVPKPVRVPENYDGQWWNRATVYANFNELVIRQSTVAYLQSADIQVKEG